jgi:quinol monooxygenase YgiN
VLLVSKPVLTHVTYRPKRGKEKQLLELVRRHWPTLHNAGLSTKDPAMVYRAQDKAGNVYFVEIFSWKDEQASSRAHQLPEVMAIWEPMGAILEGGPSPEIAQIEPVTS